jgi:phage-related protein
MARRVIYKGAVLTIAFANEQSGACPGGEFYDSLDVGDKAKLMVLFQLLADHGKCYNPQKFGDLGKGLYEFKSFQIRMPFAYARTERRIVLITHGFVKKKQKTPKGEIERAWRILEEDQAPRKLAIVKRAGE